MIPPVSSSCICNFDLSFRCIHLVDNAGMIPRGRPGHDALFKVRLLINHMKSKFRDCFSPSCQMAVDESMIGFDGRLSFKQYLPHKPTKWGIKVWEIADCNTGYCLDFDVYTGKTYEQASPNGIGYDVIRKLTDPYLHQGHHVYFDRFFSGLPIMEYLKDHGTYASGTIMTNRKGLPKALKKKKLAKGASAFYSKNNSNMLVTTWKDKKQVNLITSGSMRGVDATGKPNVISDFNKYMGGVDLNNQLCTYYKVGRPSHRWWRYIFWHCLNVAVTNAWLLFKNSASQEQLKLVPNHKKFIIKLSHQLHNGFTCRKQLGRPVVQRRILAPSLAVLNNHDLVKIDGRARICVNCSKNGNRGPNGRKKQTTFKCRQCNAALCKIECFRAFHPV